MKLKVKQTVKQSRSWQGRSEVERGHSEAKNKWQWVDSNRRPRAYESLV